MKRFWLIGNVDDKGILKSLPKQQFFAESDARVEAETLARAKHGERFVVLEAIDTVRRSDIAWEPCYDALPF
jgi:hypothetical protein